jgi:phosphatidylglycerophosphatase A
VDILKPFPVNASEKLPGGWGIMADDIVGGILVNLLLTFFRWLYIGGGWSHIL